MLLYAKVSVRQHSVYGSGSLLGPVPTAPYCTYAADIFWPTYLKRVTSRSWQRCVRGQWKAHMQGRVGQVDRSYRYSLLATPCYRNCSALLMTWLSAVQHAGLGDTVYTHACRPCTARSCQDRGIPHHTMTPDELKTARFSAHVAYMYNGDYCGLDTSSK